MRNSRGETIGIQDMEDTATFLLYHMSMETRRKFMAERPVLYRRLFPEVAPATISSRVFDTITGNQNHE